MAVVKTDFYSRDDTKTVSRRRSSSGHFSFIDRSCDDLRREWIMTTASFETSGGETATRSLIRFTTLTPIFRTKADA